MPKSYPPEFRRRAVELCRGGAVASKIARDLGVSEATIYRWVAQEEVDLGERLAPVATSTASSRKPGRGSES